MGTASNTATGGMKMYLTNKDRKIQTQQSIIQRLEEENRCLREQLGAYENKDMEHKMGLAEQAYKEYMGLATELEGLKQEYLGLIDDIVAGKLELKKRCK